MADEAKAIQKTSSREPVPFSPRNFDDGWRQAQALARSPLIPHGLKGANSEETTANVMVALMWGNELGVSPVQSLYNIHIIKGRPVVSAALKVGLVKQAPECLYFQCVETSAEKATWETHRKGNPKPLRITFTAEAARKAGLLGRQSRSGEDDNWTKWTETMLRWRAGAMLADAEYPDVTRGLGTQEEKPFDDAAPISAIPETRPVEMLTRVDVAPVSNPQSEPPNPISEAVDVETATVREPGSDDGDEPDPMEQEANAIIAGAEADDVTRDTLDGLIKRATALGLHAMDPLRAEVEAAFKAAQKRIKARG